MITIFDNLSGVSFMKTIQAQTASRLTAVSAFLVGASTLCLLISQSFAFAPRVTQVPNNQWGCALCHVSPAGGGARTVFGEQIFMFARDGQNSKWEEVCDRDADGDGATNGAELGDPSCAWRTGDPNPDAMVTDPNDAESFPEEVSGGAEAAGEIIAGEVPAGEGVAGEGVAGEGPAGEGPAGEAAAGETAAGEAAAGDMTTPPADDMGSADEGGCQQHSSRSLPLIMLTVIALILARRRLA